MNDATFERLRDDAEALGREAGDAAGSWVIDGNTTEATVRGLLRGIEDGDPEVLDTLPSISSPLSGEWADSLTQQYVIEALEVEDLTSEEQTDLFDAFEMGFSDAVVDRVETDARAYLIEDRPMERADLIRHLAGDHGLRDATFVASLASTTEDSIDAWLEAMHDDEGGTPIEED